MGATGDRSGQEQSGDGEDAGRLDRFLRALAPPEEWTAAYSGR